MDLILGHLTLTVEFEIDMAEWIDLLWFPKYLGNNDDLMDVNDLHARSVRNIVQ